MSTPLSRRACPSACSSRSSEQPAERPGVAKNEIRRVVGRSLLDRWSCLWGCLALGRFAVCRNTHSEQ
eukprot:scaffold105724_cov63-Phaeocystis_antarctica.AAC.2